MTVSTSVTQLEDYAARAVSEGRFADAAAAYKEASDNERRQDPVSVARKASDAAQGAIYAAGSHLPPGLFTRMFGSFNAVGIMTNSIEPSQLMAIGGISMFASGVWSISAPIQKWVGGTSAAMAGAGSFVSTT